MKIIEQIYALVFKYGHADSIQRRFARGGVILTAATVFERGLRLAKMMILTRIILRQDLGAVALCAGVLALFEAVSEVGIRTSVIQNKIGDQAGYLNAAWWFQAVRAVGLGLIGMITAGFVADFYNDPQMANFLRVAFLSVVCNGLASSGSYLLEKRLHFGKYVLLTQGSMIAGTLLTIVLAFIFRNVWAVITGLSSEGLIKLVLSFIICPVRPGFGLDKNALKELMSFARGIAGAPLVTFLSFQADIFVLGKMVSKEEVGMYFCALQIARIPRELAAQIMGKLLLPVFAHKQDDNDSLRLWLCEVTRWTTLATGPLAGFLTGSAAVALRLAYTPEYAAVSDVFAVLVLMMFFRVQALTVSSMYLAVKQLNLFRAFVILRAAVLLVLIVPMILWMGLIGAALAVLISEACGFVLQVAMLNHRIELEWTRFLGSIMPGLVLAAAVHITTCIMPKVMQISDWKALGAAAAVLIAAYTAGGIWQMPHLSRLLKEHSNRIP